jgi:hypothetical protein
MNDGANDYTIRLAYEGIVAITTSNIFICIRYQPIFFGVWTLEIVPTLDNMICKVIDYHGVAMNTCTHARQEPAFQFYNLNNKTYFPSSAGTDPLAHWIQFQAGNNQILLAEFYSPEFRLQGDRNAWFIDGF